MSISQQSLDWILSPGKARRLAAERLDRVLRVREGRVWLTREGNPDDHWLQPGEDFELPAGAEVVVEGWPSARFELLQAAPLSAAAAPARRASAAAPSMPPRVRASAACPA